MFPAVEQFFGDDAWLDAVVMRFTHAAAKLHCKLCLEGCCPCSGVDFGFVLADEHFATAIVGLHDKLPGKGIPIDVFGIIPMPIQLDEHVAQPHAFHMLSDTEFVGQGGPCRGVGVEFEPVDFFVDVFGVIPVNFPTKSSLVLDRSKGLRRNGPNHPEDIVLYDGISVS